MSILKTQIKCVDLTRYKEAVALGCYTDGGKIFPALSASGARGEIPAGITKAYYSRAAEMFFVCADKQLYGSMTGITFVKLADLYSDEPTIFEDYGEYGLATYVIGDGKYVVHWNGGYTEKLINSNIYGGVLKNRRLFGVDKDDACTLRWSGLDGALDWQESIDGAGWLKFSGARGKILNLIVLGEKLIAVREYGLTVISAFGTPENFKVEATDTDTPLIYKNSATIVGGKLIFCAGTGIYAFDGAKITKLNVLRQNELKRPFYAAALGEKYFLCGYSSALERRALLCYDALEETQYLIDSPAETLAVSDRVLCFTEDGAITLDEGCSFKYICGALDFDTHAKKVLTDIYIDCCGSAKVIVESGGKTRSFTTAKRRLRVDMCGSEFNITVKSECEIYELKAYAEVISGV